MKISKMIMCDTIQKVHQLVNLTSRVQAKVYARHSEYVVDGKSLLGLMSLDLSTPICIDCDDMPEEIIKELNEFSIYKR